MESPKETNRQLGQVIYQWIEKETLGIKVYSDIEMFNNSKETKKILNGSDGFLQDYADKYIYDNCSLEEYEAFKDKNKGIDFLALIDGKLVIAEMKFLTDRGGHQDRQIDDALGLSSLEFSNDKVIPIALVDGVCYIEQEKAKKSMYKKIKRAEERKNYVMSVLVLQDFLFQL